MDVTPKKSENIFNAQQDKRKEEKQREVGYRSYIAYMNILIFLERRHRPDIKLMTPSKIEKAKETRYKVHGAVGSAYKT